MQLTQAQLQRRIDAAQGRIPCDLVITDVRYLDVFSCEWRQGDIAIIDGVIVGLEPGLQGQRTLHGQGKFLTPGFVDAHVHVESSMMLPVDFQQAVLPRGTTTAICDPHELANVMGLEGLQYFLDAAATLHLDLRVMLSSCVPATDMETNGAGHLTADQLLPLLQHPKALGLAEMMNFPGVLHNTPEVLEKLAAFSGHVIDGHCPLVSGQALSAYAAAGMSSCHESTQLAEAREKLTKGLGVWIREGSAAKDLQALAPLLTLATSTSLGFCTDDRNPLDIAAEGHIDHLVRRAIGYGVPAAVAYRTASWSVARHYGLRRTGAIAPGYTADLILLDDAETCAVRDVLKEGVPVTELEGKAAPAHSVHNYLRNTVQVEIPAASALAGSAGRVHVIGVQAGRIITDRSVEDHHAAGVARLSVLERYGHGSKPANGYVRGFGTGFRGAIASSVGHDSHNLITVGTDTADMRTALAALAECGGGFCVVRDGAVASRLALPFGGLMSTAGISQVDKSLRDLQQASQAVGCELPEPFLQLAFLSLPVIPSLKLTDKGLVDVHQFKIIDVRAA
jgi:adenine deaminase